MNQIPQVVATWLVEQSDTPKRNGPFMGDLIEGLVALTAVGDIWNHKLLAVRAIATGLIAMLPLRAIRFHLASQRWGDNPFVFWSLTFLSFGFAGWVVAQTHTTWLFSAHYGQFWSGSHPYRFPIDVSLTGAALLCSLAGGFL